MVPGKGLASGSLGIRLSDCCSIICGRGSLFLIELPWHLFWHHLTLISGLFSVPFIVPCLCLHKYHCLDACSFTVSLEIPSCDFWLLPFCSLFKHCFCYFWSFSVYILESACQILLEKTLLLTGTVLTLLWNSVGRIAVLIIAPSDLWIWLYLHFQVLHW